MTKINIITLALLLVMGPVTAWCFLALARRRVRRLTLRRRMTA